MGVFRFDSGKQILKRILTLKEAMRTAGRRIIWQSHDCRLAGFLEFQGKVKHRFESTAVHMNNVHYYQPDKSLALNPNKISITAKRAVTEPKIIFKNSFMQIAYNQRHQLAVAKQISEMIESRKQGC